MKLQASLFSGAGFGDTGFRSAGLEHVLLAEIEPKRAALARSNFGRAVHTIDVEAHVDPLIHHIERQLRERKETELFLLTATPPCQGMSKNGIGSLIRSKASGYRPEVDARNRLYLPVLHAMRRLLPKWFFFENVCRMMNTFDADESGKSRLVTDLMSEQLWALGYEGCFQQVELADFGLPQRRLRTVGLFRRGGRRQCNLLPAPTHSSNPVGSVRRWRTLREVLGHFPALDAKGRRSSPVEGLELHRVPRWRDELYRWLAATPEGQSAFENDCPSCIIANEKTLTHCRSCGEDLCRPTVVRDGVLQIISGFPSAYKRMYWDRPGSTVTTRSAYVCSDHKGHPEQHRVLSTLEVAILQGIDVSTYRWCMPDESKMPQDTLLRDVIGECVPPLFTGLLGRHIQGLEDRHAPASSQHTKAAQLTLL